MTYAVEILRIAQKQLAKIDRQAQSRIIESIRRLSSDPRPPGCKKLSGRPAWRIRVGSYRVIYEIHDDQLVVLVVSVGARKDVYR
jgi:mRNA interferase RelE/StbE